MFKRIATSTLIVGALMSVVPSLASAQEYHRDGDRGRVEYRDRARDRVEYRDPDRDRFEYRERIRHQVRGYYDRFGCWHSY